METEGLAKRRKLDTPHKKPASQSPTALGTPTKLTHSEKLPSGARGKSGPPGITHGAGSESSVQKGAREEPTGRSQARRENRNGTTARRGKEVDVHNGIESAHSKQASAKRGLAQSATPSKKRLDPLRNQRIAASPSAKSFASGAALGFFKQFHPPNLKNPAAGIQPRDVANERPGKTARAQNGTENKVLEVEPGLESSAEEEDGEGDSGKHTPSRSGQSGTGWKGWQYADQPKKTFEDEIRDLEAAARVHAEKENDTDALAKDPQSSRKRKSTFKQSENMKVLEDKVHVSRARVSKGPRDNERRKHDVNNCDETDAPVVIKNNERMELDIAEPRAEVSRTKESVADHSAEPVTPSKAKPQQRIKTPQRHENVAFAEEHIQQLQRLILDRLAAKRAIPLMNLDEEHTKVSSLISQTITSGESNSMLLIGARGSGKTALTNHVFRQQAIEHPDAFHVVRLNGLIHTDDKIALREIWRQLGREMELGDDESTSKNYADTLTTLLALLSHPVEFGREELDCMTKSVIFILDEFDLFASHPRQTLLYNLFDIAQSRKAPIAVLGLTTRVDVSESLEKRVKSRFSHRYVHLSLAKSFVAFQDACKAALSVRSEELNAMKQDTVGPTGGLTAKLERAAKADMSSVAAQWNLLVDDLLADEAVSNFLRRLFYTSKSVPDFHAAMLMPMTTIPVDSPVTSEALLHHLTSNFTGILSGPESRLSLLGSLSILQLALLICAARLTNIHDSETVPFVQAYEEYKVLASKAKLQASASGALAQGAGSRVWGKDVAKGAWDELMEFGLILGEGTRGGRVDVGLEEIGICGVELGSWARWCREI